MNWLPDATMQRPKVVCLVVSLSAMVWRWRAEPRAVDVYVVY